MASCSDCGGIVVPEIVRTALSNLESGFVDAPLVFDEMSPEEFNTLCDLVSARGGSKFYAFDVGGKRPEADAIKLLRACNTTKLESLAFHSHQKASDALREIALVLHTNASIKSCMVRCNLWPADSLEILTAAGSMRRALSAEINLKAADMGFVSVLLDSRSRITLDRPLPEPTPPSPFNRNERSWEEHVMLGALGAMPGLQTLYFHMRYSGKTWHSELYDKLVSLKFLSAISARIDRDSHLSLQLASALRFAKSIQRVYYHGEMNDDIAEAFASAIRGSETLRSLGFFRLDDDAHYRALADAIVHSASLREIYAQEGKYRTVGREKSPFERAFAARSMLALAGADSARARHTPAAGFRRQTGDNLVETNVMGFLLP